MSNKWKVYKIVSPTNKVYIGCTALPLEKRWSHGHGYKTNPTMFNDILLYGWNNFETYLVAEYDDELEARSREHEEIQKYPNTYNRYRGQKDRSTGNSKTPPKRVKCVETGIIYDSIYQAAVQTGLAKNKISYCCRGIRNKTGGYHWRFV